MKTSLSGFKVYFWEYAEKYGYLCYITAGIIIMSSSVHKIPVDDSQFVLQHEFVMVSCQ